MKSYDYKFKSLGKSENIKIYFTDLVTFEKGKKQELSVHKQKIKRNCRICIIKPMRCRIIFNFVIQKNFLSISAAEPKQVIRSLRLKSSCLPRSLLSKRPSISERSLIEKSSSWKLPPNVYRLRDHFEDVSKKQMGKLGPYQCFTVERDASTVKNHHASKPLEDICELFYDVPIGMEAMMLMSRSRNKSKFLKSERFEERRHQFQDFPPATKYYPQNFVMKPKSCSKLKVTMKNHLIYYPHTTVPAKEMSYLKEVFPKPPPGRYDPHDVVCKCYLTDSMKKCPGNVRGDGHRHVFNSKVCRLVRPVIIDKQRPFSDGHVDDSIVQYKGPAREPISFRTKRSQSFDDLTQSREREIRFNTMVKKRNLFSVKTGRPVGFLAAMPRFQESSEVSIKLEKERILLMTMEELEKPRRKPMTKKRLEELAAPKNPLPKIASNKAKIFEPLPSPSTKKIAKKHSIIGLPSALSEIELKAKQDEEDEATMRDLQVFVTGTQSAK